jgi:hypothetical protein
MSTPSAFRVRTNIGNYRVVLTSPPPTLPAGQEADGKDATERTVADVKKALQQQHFPHVGYTIQVLQHNGENLLDERPLQSYQGLNRDSILTLMNKLEKSVVEKAYIAEGGSYVAAGTVIIRAQLLSDGAIPSTGTDSGTATMTVGTEEAGNDKVNSSMDVSIVSALQSKPDVMSLLDDTPIKPHKRPLSGRDAMDSWTDNDVQTVNNNVIYGDLDSPRQVREAMPSRRMRLVDETPGSPTSIAPPHVLRTV